MENKAFARTCLNDIKLRQRQAEYDNQMIGNFVASGALGGTHHSISQHTMGGTSLSAVPGDNVYVSQQPDVQAELNREKEKIGHLKAILKNSSQKSLVVKQGGGGGASGRTSKDNLK